MFNLAHRYILISVPDALWIYQEDLENKKVYMYSAIKTLDQLFSKQLRKGVKVGVITILHSFGKDMKHQPHLHLLITEGAFDESGKFIHCKYIPASAFRKIWQYHVIKSFQVNGLSNKIASQMYKQYSNGFYAWVHKNTRIKSPRIICKYVGRYVRHPAIFNSRIIRYANGKVYFYYIDHDKKKVNIVMDVDEFIRLLISYPNLTVK